MSARLNRSADVAAGDWLTGFSSLFGAGDCFGVGVVAVTGAGSVGAVFITGGSVVPTAGAVRGFGTGLLFSPLIWSKSSQAPSRNLS